MRKHENNFFPRLPRYKAIDKVNTEHFYFYAESISVFGDHYQWRQRLYGTDGSKAGFIFQSFDRLEAAEKEFLNLCMPSHSYPSQDILGTECCPKKCVFFVRRLLKQIIILTLLQFCRVDILCSRFHYLQFFNSMGTEGKRKARQLFISTLVRVSNDSLQFAPCNMEVSICGELLSRIFGFSLNVLVQSLTIRNFNFYPC